MIRHIQYELKQRGFDLCHPLHTSWYNNLINEDGLVENGSLELLPVPPTIVDDDGGTTTTSTTSCNYYNAILIGNTKHIWPIFIHWLSSMVDRKMKESIDLTDREALKTITNPFDTYVMESIHQTLQRCSMSHPEIKCCELFWSSGKRQKLYDVDRLEESYVDSGANHNNNADDETSFLVSMQRVATTTGMYWLDNEATKLCVHPEYGTWMAFRVLVVLETPSCSCCCSIPLAPTPCSCPVSSDEIRLAKEIFEYALDMSRTEGYGTTLNKSWQELCDYLHDISCTGTSWDKVPKQMKPWIHLRDSISVGRERWKYGQEQLLYHYTRDSEILFMELMKVQRLS
jgi:hypothetical protein